jgi:ribosomal protein S18 acetylase RimI-like enzyme
LSSLQSVRRAEKKDVTRLAVTLSHAFNKDPIMSWCIRDDLKRPEAMRCCFEYMLSNSVKFGEVTCTVDMNACAIWLPPGKWLGVPSFPETLLQLPDLIRWMGFSRINRWIKMINIEANYRPKTPHFYLAFLGVEPDKQGLGLGSLLLKDKLQSIDSISLPTYLENSNIRNMPLYERYGFRVTGELKVSEDLKMLAMWRDAVFKNGKINDK